MRRHRHRGAVRWTTKWRPDAPEPGPDRVAQAGGRLHHRDPAPEGRFGVGEARSVRRPRGQGGPHPVGHALERVAVPPPDVEIERPVAVRREGDAGAVGRPRGVGLDPGIVGDALGRAADGVDPEVAQRRKGHLPPVGRHRRRHDAARREGPGPGQVARAALVVGAVQGDGSAEGDVAQAAAVGHPVADATVARVVEAVRRRGRAERKDVLVLAREAAGAGRVIAR